MAEESAESLLSFTEGIAARYSQLPQVETVAVAGSQTTGTADDSSDIDLYVYMSNKIHLSVHAHIATAKAEYAEVDNRFWEPGDEWIDADTGTHVDVMFRSVEWIEAQLDRMLRLHQASVGYSTCLWYNVLSSQVL